MTSGDAGDPQQATPTDRRRSQGAKRTPASSDPRVDDTGSRGLQRPNGSTTRPKPRRGGATRATDPLARVNGPDDATVRPATFAADAMPTIVPAEPVARGAARAAVPSGQPVPVPDATVTAPVPATARTPERVTAPVVPAPAVPSTVPDATVVVPSPPPAAPAPEAATPSAPLLDIAAPDDSGRGVVLRRRPRPRVRRVTRIVRHVDTWSVFKVALVFNAVLYLTCLTAGVLLWNVAYTTGTVDNVETFFEQFGWESFEFNGGEIYHGAWIAGLFVAIGLTGLAVLLATLFNLITDLVGGVRVSVLEEEVVARQFTREQVASARARRRDARAAAAADGLDGVPAPSHDGGPPTERLDVDRRP